MNCEFEPHSVLYTWKRWFLFDMAEKLFTKTFNHNANQVHTEVASSKQMCSVFQVAKLIPDILKAASLSLGTEQIKPGNTSNISGRLQKKKKNEPPHGKTNNLHRRKQRRRSASL